MGEYVMGDDGSCCRTGNPNYPTDKVSVGDSYERIDIELLNSKDPRVIQDADKLAFKPAKAKSILEEANEIINGDRAKAYGHPRPNHEAIASLWSAYLNNREILNVTGDLTAADAAIMMVLLKVARLQFLPTHRDSLVDIAGYVGCIERIVSD